MIVVDTSAVVAVLAGEAGAERVLDVLASSSSARMAAASYLECGIVVAARFGDDGVHDLRLFLHEARIDVAATDREQADLALDAWSRYGKGRHPAGLNYGDCFAYALAVASAAPLLFVGEDFARTDVAVA